jgi:hypothetical protein
MAYDPTNEAIVRDLLAALDPQEGDDGLPYVDLLRRTQAVLVDLLAQGEALTPEQEQAIAQALSHLHPAADDHLVDGGTRLRRLQTRIDVELSKWTSALVQPPGPSGATAVPDMPPAPVE